MKSLGNVFFHVVFLVQCRCRRRRSIGFRARHCRPKTTIHDWLQYSVWSIYERQFVSALRRKVCVCVWVSVPRVSGDWKVRGGRRNFARIFEFSLSQNVQQPSFIRTGAPFERMFCENVKRFWLRLILSATRSVWPGLAHSLTPWLHSPIWLPFERKWNDAEIEKVFFIPCRKSLFCH